jgi:hypothetical protein
MIDPLDRSYTLAAVVAAMKAAGIANVPEGLYLLAEAVSECQAAQAARAVSEMADQEPERPRSLQALDERWQAERAAVIGPQMARLRELARRIEVLEELAAASPPGAVRERIMAAVAERRSEWDRLAEGLAPDFQRVTSRYPDSPHVECFETGEAADTSWVRPHRAYLDVTDATWQEVQKLWPLIMWRHTALRQRGHSVKRPRGNQSGPRVPEVKSLVDKAREGDRRAARKACINNMVAEGWDRTEAGRWYDKVVGHHLGKGAAGPASKS